MADLAPVIDISHWNGAVDGPGLVREGIKGVIVAGGDGAFLDPMFEHNCEVASTVNPSLLHIYHYLRFWLEPEQQADVFLHRAETARRINKKIFLWPDWEDTSPNCAALSVSERQRWASTFLYSLEANGLNYGHYTGGWWFGPHLGLPTGKLGRQFFDHPLWIGDYRAQPTLPQGWLDWQVWQYSSSGRLASIPNAFVDLNWAKVEFFGKEEIDVGLSQEEVDARIREALDPIRLQLGVVNTYLRDTQAWLAFQAKYPLVVADFASPEKMAAWDAAYRQFRQAVIEPRP